MPPAEDKSATADAVEPSLNEVLDMNTFNQILEMDEPDDQQFSSSIVFDFFDQADETFKEMDAALKDGNLAELSSLGHFLKGSSATLGLVKVREGCEKIQRYGKKENVDGKSIDDETLCLDRIKDEIKTVKVDIKEARQALYAYYGKDKNDA